MFPPTNLTVNLELFLPFDLDHAFSAGFVLALINVIQPFSDADAADDSYHEKATSILDVLIAGGNEPARFRRQELERLHEMLRLVDQQQNASHQMTTTEQESQNIFALGQGEQGISPNQMLNVASLLDYYPSLNHNVIDSWLWETTSFEGGFPLSSSLGDNGA